MKDKQTLLKEISELIIPEFEKKVLKDMVDSVDEISDEFILFLADAADFMANKNIADSGYLLSVAQEIKNFIDQAEKDKNEAAEKAFEAFDKYLDDIKSK